MDTIELSRKQRFWVGFAAGLAAGVIATGVMLWLSVGSEGISLPEVFGSKLTALTPPPLFDFLHRLIRGDAKHYLFYGILVGQCLVFALSGALYSVVASRRSAGSDSEKTPHRGHLQWYDGLRLALILWAATGLLLLPLTGAGIFGSALIIGPLNGILSLAEVGAIFGLVFVLLQNLFIDRFP